VEVSQNMQKTESTRITIDNVT